MGRLYAYPRLQKAGNIINDVAADLGALAYKEKNRFPFCNTCKLHFSLVLPPRVLYRIFNLGVLKYEWGSGSAEPGARRSHAGGGCGRGSPLPPRGSEVSPPEKFRNFTCKILNFGAHLGKIVNLLC
jgi:hypothetical protein